MTPLREDYSNDELQFNAHPDAHNATNEEVNDHEDRLTLVEDSIVALRTVTTNTTVQAGDVGNILEVNSTTSKTVTIPKNASLALAVGSEIVIRRIGIGAVTIAPEDGTVTLDAPGGGLAIQHQYGVVVVSKRATNEWVVDGDNAAAPTFADRDNGQAGMAAGPLWGGTNSISGITNNRAYILRLAPSRQITATKIAYVCNGASPDNDAVDVGIYDSSLARLVSKGSTTGQLNSTGVKSLSISSTVLNPGSIYYAAIAIAVATTGATLLGLNITSALGAKVFGSSAPQLEMGFQAAALPLPSTLASIDATGVTSVPLLWVLE
jgi:hypothetical protein